MASRGRALGIAESYQTDQSTLCAACTTPAGRPDGFWFSQCTVGGLDATAAILDLWEHIARADIQYVFVSGVALAWYNIVDLQELSETIPVPVLSLSYESSAGLGKSIKSEFSGEDERTRLERYRALPDRHQINLETGTIYVRTADECSIALRDLLETYTIDGGRPEPVRIARLAARAADRWHRVSP